MFRPKAQFAKSTSVQAVVLHFFSCSEQGVKAAGAHVDGHVVTRTKFLPGNENHWVYDAIACSRSKPRSTLIRSRQVPAKLVDYADTRPVGRRNSVAQLPIELASMAGSPQNLGAGWADGGVPAHRDWLLGLITSVIVCLVSMR